ncbi:unnamed protein product [Acanthoscelides obtectus]|uniref:PiggyBac transposable element-derived protein domain-containing protein n=1 Tax=Acanthoscelides obtectus TaxID=200917 RepID=A0A9P0L307_ACAOB|nr:unnamed protein product [Acanthoscelides obtectus]CAK1660429.1 PiggyBac transposable element-derived protein 3 [Acanthoscelides obtectus]
MPAYTDYWSQKFRYNDIAEIMSLKRYQQIRRHIHFVNNANQNDDPYFKIRPALEIVRRNCMSVEEEKKQSIDEMMVPYKGKKAGSKRQYIKSKPKKWGFKIFVGAGVSGLVYDFLIYGGEKTFREYHQFTSEENTLGLGAKVILSLCKSMKAPICSAVYFDNFFTSLELVHILKQNYGILSLGTIRSNRLGICSLENDKALAKRGRGSFCFKNDNVNKISCVKWFDNKAVILVSSYVSVEPVATATRYTKHKKDKTDIPCPSIVKQYNRHIGGVDLMDMLVSLYRTRRWYLSIFAQMIDLCMNNAWLLYRRETKLTCAESGGNVENISLKEFRYYVSKSLRMKGRSTDSRVNENVDIKQRIKQAVVVRPPIDVRHDRVDHFSQYISKGRCRLCKKGETHWACTKCGTRLCLVKDRNCFYTFHQSSRQVPVNVNFGFFVQL